MIFLINAMYMSRIFVNLTILSDYQLFYLYLIDYMISIGWLSISMCYTCIIYARGYCLLTNLYALLCIGCPYH